MVLIPLFHAGLEIFPDTINQYIEGKKSLLFPEFAHQQPLLPGKRKRGRPKGRKDSKPRKRRKFVTKVSDG